MNDELVKFLDDDGEEEQVVHPEVAPWIVGIIDDEPAIHDVTKLALRGVSFYGKPVEFISAYSGKEGFEMLANHPEIAVVLLDVVMESDDAGLLLVDRIRNELNNSAVQIVLRTGQPGYAPEDDVIIRYEINSYKTKGELTRNKLFTSLAAAIRSFQQIQTIEKSRDGLRQVISASASMLKERSVYDFSSGVLTQIDALFEMSSDSLFCISKRPASAPFAIKSNDEGLYVVAANKAFSQYFDRDVTKITHNEPAIDLALAALKQKKHLFDGQFGCLYLATPSGWQGVIVAENADKLEQSDQELLQIFCMNVALGLENAKFFTYLNKAAFSDELTGLYNRTGLIEESSRLLHHAQVKSALYLIDIDYFHQIIASLGYDFGNHVLVRLAAIVSDLFNDSCIVARVHADVFAVFTVAGDLTACEVSAKCSRPMLIEGQSIRLGLTVGAVHCQPDKPEDIPTLLRKAEMALHVAKDHKRGTGEEFTEGFELESRKNMAILNDFRVAIEQQELFLVLQPKVNINSGQVCGFEALIRWSHPKNGLIPPVAFIPAVEKSGMNYDLDLYVAKQVCETIKQHDFKGLPISFNISANSLMHENFTLELINILQQPDINLSDIQVEVTENALIHSERSIARLRDLYDAGVNICLDDFGAGFSSLSYLLRLPLHTIKIDRAFVSDLVGSPKSVTVLEGMLSILTKLNKDIVVEGVETDEQLALLEQLGVEVVQGFKFYKPMSLEQALQLLS